MEDTKKEGDTIQLKNQMARIEKCKVCDGLMVNLDVDQLALGDLTILKLAGVAISNPETDKAVCIKCEYKTFGKKIADFFESTDDDDDNDDSSFFHSSGGFLGGHSSGGGFSGGFGGFGGGGFSGGGASRAF